MYVSIVSDGLRAPSARDASDKLSAQLAHILYAYYYTTVEVFVSCVFIVQKCYLCCTMSASCTKHVACTFDKEFFILSFFFQMSAEQFTPRHTSQREWCSCSGVKVSLPSWPPSSRSPPRQESYSPSTSLNTGNPSVTIPLFGSQLLLFFFFCTALLPRVTKHSHFKLDPEMKSHNTGSCLQMAVDEV